MSHDISSFNVKKIKNLITHTDYFFESSRDDWHPEIKDIGNGYVLIEGGCEQEIKAKVLEDGFLELKEFSITGEGSGNFWRYVLEHVLKESTGKLNATMIWEGQEIYRLKLKNGLLELKEIT